MKKLTREKRNECPYTIKLVFSFCLCLSSCLLVWDESEGCAREMSNNNKIESKQHWVEWGGEHRWWFLSRKNCLTHSTFACGPHTVSILRTKLGISENIIHTEINIVVVLARVVLLFPPSLRMSQRCFSSHSREKNLTQWMDGRKATTQHTFALSGWQWKELFPISWFGGIEKKRDWVCEHRTRKKVPSCTTFAICAFTSRPTLLCVLRMWSSIWWRCAVSICEAQFGCKLGLNFGWK